MDNDIDNMLCHMSKSQQALAGILGAGQVISRSAAGLIDQPPAGKFQNREAIALLALDVTRNAATYVKALAELEEALAASLQLVIRQLQSGDDANE